MTDTPQTETRRRGIYREWPAEAVAMLRDMWHAHCSGTEIRNAINRTFGTSYSRSAIVGRANRLDVPRRPSPIKAGTRNDQRPMPSCGPHKRCQWIEGEPSRDDACKCNRPTVVGSAYCEEHQARSRTEAA